MVPRSIPTDGVDIIFVGISDSLKKKESVFFKLIYSNRNLSSFLKLIFVPLEGSN